MSSPIKNLVQQILVLIFLTAWIMGATNGAGKVDRDNQGRPLWEQGVIWVKVKPHIQIDRKQNEIQSFNVTSLDDKIKRFGIESIYRAFHPIERPGRTDLPDLSRIFRLTLPTNARTDLIAQAIDKDPNVEYAEQIPAAYPEAIPNDAFYDSIMYHLPQMQAEEAWDIHKGENGIEEVIVGICDSGVDWKHPDLASNIYNNLGEDADGDGQTMLWDGDEWVMDTGDLNGIDDDGNGYIDDLIGWNMMADEFGTQNNDPMEAENRRHGTHVSGLAAGVTNNEVGIASISWNVKILATSHSYAGAGGQYIYNGYDGLVYLADNGADIINASWGGGGYSQAAAEVVEYIGAVGALFVSSAGNDDDGSMGMVGFGNFYPSSYPGCVSVASVDRYDQKAWYSSFGWGVDISTPGGNHEPGLLSTIPGGYASFSGTSMASPVAAGMFALLKSYHPDWTNEQLIRQVIGTTDDINSQNPAYENWLGSGRVNAFRALSEDNVTVPPELRLLLWEVVSSNPAAQDWTVEPGESTDLSFVFRNYSHLVGDSSVTVTLTASTPDIQIGNASFLDTISADGFSTIGTFAITIAEDAHTDLASLTLTLDSPGLEILPSATFNFDLFINTISLASHSLDLNLISGDIDTSTVTVTNSANIPADLTAVTLSLDPNSLLWHVDNSNAYDGESWWCGDADLGGYPDDTYQFLMLPGMDLSSATNPQLRFMLDWYIENPGGADAPFDGWDGANVWISTDGGDLFEVIEPVTPAYTCTALAAWGGHWDFGMVPGWAGDNNGYVEALFDLSAYASDEVVIRFGFASDGGATGLGVFIDNIVVMDDASVFYTNAGTFGGGVRLDGFPADTIETTWLQLPMASFTVPGSGSFDLDLVSNTNVLEDDFYTTTINMMYEGFVLDEVDVTLSIVNPPEHDLSINEYSISNGGLAVLREDSVSVTIENLGVNDEHDFAIRMMLISSTGTVYADTIPIASLEAGMTATYTFARYAHYRSEALTLLIELLDAPDDSNANNNRIISEEVVTFLIDTFSEANSLWDMDGWGLTDNMEGHMDDYSVHVDGGNSPYAPNLDHSMTFIQPLDLTLTGDLSIYYWTYFETEPDLDVMTFEVSSDGENWEILKSHSGNDLSWTQHSVHISNHFEAGEEYFWLRFHFVSDASGSGMGVLVDDVEFHTINAIAIDGMLPDLPHEFSLHQNYPNPFNPSTTISYALPKAADVIVQVFDIQGRLVSSLVDARQSAGYYDHVWQAGDLSGNSLDTGIYLARIQAGDYSRVIKMLYLK